MDMELGRKQVYFSFLVILNKELLDVSLFFHSSYSSFRKFSIYLDFILLCDFLEIYFQIPTGGLYLLNIFQITLNFFFLIFRAYEVGMKSELFYHSFI